jgi:hypothetical protein
MRRSLFAGSVCAVLVLFAAPLPAQDVTADVVVRSRPVTGRIVIADRAPPDRVVVVRRTPARRGYLGPVRPRIIVVERFRDHGKHWRRWKHGYRAVTVFYFRGRYYDRFDPRYPGVQRIIVYQRDGHFYRDD